MKHINSIIMALVTSMIVWMPSNVALAQPTDGDGGTTGGGVTGGDGSTVSSPISIDGDFSDCCKRRQSVLLYRIQQQQAGARSRHELRHGHDKYYVAHRRFEHNGYDELQ